MNEQYAPIFDAIRKYDRIIIHRHGKPDGDAMGSQLGLYHWLRAHFPEKTVYRVGDPAGRYGFLTGSTMDSIPDSVFDGSLCILLDTASPALISDDRYRLAEQTIRFDHHLFVGTFCDLECVDPSFESCCGLLTDFILQTGYPLTPACAEPLYVGMATDSGRFRYDSTTPRTFRLASELLSQELDLTRIYRSLYEEPLDRMQLRARFIEKITQVEDRVAYIYTTKQELEAFGMDPFSASRGMVGVMNDIKGIDIWVNFTEAEEGVLCELRSSRFDIHSVAVKYGGGGHEKASGAVVPDRNTALLMVQDLQQVSRGEQFA